MRDRYIQEHIQGVFSNEQLLCLETIKLRQELMAKKEEFDWSDEKLDPVSTVAKNDLSEQEKANIKKMMEALGL